MKKIVKIVLTFVGAAIFLYLSIWIWFSSTGPFPSGLGLDKKDWLQFFGSFLGFMGTTFLGFLTIWQSNEIEKKNAIIRDKANIFPCINNKIILTYNEEIIDFNHYFANSTAVTFLREKDAEKGVTADLLIPFTCSGRVPDSISVSSLVITWYVDGAHNCECVPESEKYISCTSASSNVFSLYLLLGEDKRKCNYFEYMKRLKENPNEILSFDLKMKIKINSVVTDVFCTLFVQKKGIDIVITQGGLTPKLSYIDRAQK